MKFILGVLLAIALLIGGTVAASLYLVAELTALPPKPEFETAPDDPEPEPTLAPAATPTPTPASEEPAPPEEEALPPGAYRARVIWPEGLVLRDSPDYNAARVGGAAYNSEAIVIETSEDGSWQRLRLENSDAEGWVVGGNTEKIE